MNRRPANYLISALWLVLVLLSQLIWGISLSQPACPPATLTASPYLLLISQCQLGLCTCAMCNINMCTAGRCIKCGHQKLPNSFWFPRDDKFHVSAPSSSQKQDVNSRTNSEPIIWKCWRGGWECHPETGEMSEPLAASLSCPGSYPNGNLYEQKSNHFRDLGPQSLLNLMSISLNFRKVERKRHLES